MTTIPGPASDGAPGFGRGAAPRLRPSLTVGLLLTLAAAAYLALAPDDAADAERVALRPTRPSRPGDGAAAAGRPAVSAAGALPARGNGTASAPPRRWPQALAARPADAWPTLDDAAARAWGLPPPAPPPPPTAAAVAATPQAPPLGYHFIGRIDEGDGLQRGYLASATRTLGVKPGDEIDGQWRVEAVSADGVALLWLPGGLRQVIGFKTP
jgi:hypothetical protein